MTLDQPEGRCPDAEALVSAVAGSLSPAESERLDEHLEVCEECASMVLRLSIEYERGLGLESSSRARERLIRRAPEGPPPQATEPDIGVPGPGPVAEQTPRPPSRVYAFDQLKFDQPRKRLSAQWAVRQMPITRGAALFFEASSNCFYAWKEVRRKVENVDPDQRLDHVTVSTNSFLLLNDYASGDSMAGLVTQGVTVEILGDRFYPVHLAFYGGFKSKTEARTLRPSVLFIGASGIEFDDRSIWFGCHAGDSERQAKADLFRWAAGTRVILTTAAKIGNPSGVVFDLLDPQINIYKRAPIYLVTTAPSARNPGEAARYRQALKTYLTDDMQAAINGAGIDFHWVEVFGPGESDWVDYSQSDPSRALDEHIL